MTLLLMWCRRTCTKEVFLYLGGKQDWFMIIAHIFKVFTVPLHINTNDITLYSGPRQDLPPTLMSSASLPVNASNDQLSRDSFSTAMTKIGIVLVLAITITIVNCALIQTIRKHQVSLFVVGVVVCVSIRHCLNL